MDSDVAQNGMRKRWPALLLLAMLSVVYFWFTRFKAPKQVDVASLNLTTPDGHPLPDGLLKGKPVILNFWAPWCGPCNVEAPWLQAVQDRHAGDLVVVGVNDDPDTDDQIAEFAIRNDVRYPLVVKNGRVRDVVGTLAAVPTTLYIDRSGRVVHTITGAVPEPLMESFAEDALKN
jgi:thiol-disulfide isomerase/thioredoxin